MKPAKPSIPSNPEPTAAQRQPGQRQPTPRTPSPRPPAQRAPAHPEKVTVDVKTDKGHLTIVGTATAVIAALAVIGLIVVSLYVLKLAERAIDRGESDSANQPLPQ